MARVHEDMSASQPGAARALSTIWSTVGTVSMHVMPLRFTSSIVSAALKPGAITWVPPSRVIAERNTTPPA
jgi:hypothetical protein